MSEREFNALAHISKAVAVIGVTDAERYEGNDPIDALAHEFFVAHSMKDLVEKRYQKARDAIMRAGLEAKTGNVLHESGKYKLLVSNRAGQTRLNTGALMANLSKKFPNVPMPELVQLVEDSKTVGAASVSYSVDML